MLPAGSENGRVYPASTGIGTAGRGIVLSAIALVSDRSDIRAVPLENPRQTAAYDYAASYSPQSPKFSRAMVLSCGTYTTIFISGTASITHSQTRHPGDAVKQTEETLDNIAALIAEENLARHGLPGLGTSLASLGFARVYIKRPEDYTAVRAICEQRLGKLPTIYAIADICRPELLVEIEGVAFSRLERYAGYGPASIRVSAWNSLDASGAPPWSIGMSVSFAAVLLTAVLGAEPAPVAPCDRSRVPPI